MYSKIADVKSWLVLDWGFFNDRNRTSLMFCCNDLFIEVIYIFNIKIHLWSYLQLWNNRPNANTRWIFFAFFFKNLDYYVMSWIYMRKFIFFVYSDIYTSAEVNHIDYCFLLCRISERIDEAVFIVPISWCWFEW